VDGFNRGGLRFAVRDRGPSGGTPVVLLHGFPAGAETWSAVAPVLAGEGLRVLAPDQRGYSPGARPPGRRPYRLDELTADVVALLDAAGVHRAHIVGHDWGGSVAWAMAIRHPDRVASLVPLSTPHPAAYQRSLLDSDQALRSWYIVAFQLPWLPERLLAPTTPARRARFVNTLVRSGLGPAYANRYADRFAEPGALGAALNWYRALPLLPSGGLTRHVAVPTLYVWGRRDRYLGIRAARLTAEWVTGPYRVVVLPDAGHWLPEEHGDRVARLILEHVRHYG
jgi:pimeloyl-ACP methyl ester carboxylesterase